ncbi:MAG: hypothetical protein JNM62_13865 [Flavobacteriales bacterium]|nr:hypothetical protein [Flavobacteriales bacterium]
MSTARPSAKGGRPATGNTHPKPPGIGRSAITGRFMSVAAAKAHKKTAIVIGGRRRKEEQ